jgi:hypothetical protein
MNINNAIKELKDTWGYTTEELNHIKDLMEEISHDVYILGYNDCRADLEKISNRDHVESFS